MSSNSSIPFIVSLIPAFIFLLVLLQGGLCIVWGCCLLLNPGLWCHPLNSVEWIPSDRVHSSRCREHGYFKPYSWLENFGVTQVIWNQQHEMTFFFLIGCLTLKLYFLILTCVCVCVKRIECFDAPCWFLLSGSPSWESAVNANCHPLFHPWSSPLVQTNHCMLSLASLLSLCLGVNTLCPVVCFCFYCT